MEEQILVPLDGSGFAERALPHAIAVAKATSRSLVLLQSVPPPIPFGEVGWAVGPTTHTEMWSGWEEELLNAREYLKNVAERLAEEGLQVRTERLQGDPAEEIVRYAEEHPRITLIAMSTHGRSGLDRWVFGSVAEKVVQASPVPLLIIRAKDGTPIPQTSDTPIYSTIIVPLDGSTFAEQALEHAVPLATTMQAKLVLVCAVPDNLLFGDVLTSFDKQTQWDSEYEIRAAYLQDVKQKLLTHCLDVEIQMKNGAPQDVILKTSDQAHADLLVMTTHGRGGLTRLWLGSIATGVVRHASQPVLLVRTKERVKEPEHERTTAQRLVLAAPSPSA